MALRDTRVVAITGPRQSGKTTLVRRFARQGRTYVTLDDRATLAAARSDPVAFVRDLDRAVIDEVQRAPEILLAIKRAVDEDKRPGRFLLTGSANLSTIKTVHESLAGRIETIPLYPLSRSEILKRKKTQFVTSIFGGQVPSPAETLTPNGIVQLIAGGGYPEALARRTERRRQDWYRAYVESIVERDVPEVTSLARPGQIPRLLQFAAQFAGRLVNLSEIGRSVALDHKTTDHYLQVLEQLFLIKRLQPWSRNELSRIVKTPKLHFLDSGLLTAMRGYTASRLRTERELLGPLLEGFVFSELLKLTSESEERVTLFHFRDRDQHEVDFVLENAQGQIVGIEVKSAASVTRSDFSGLDRLASLAGKHFVQGLVLYDGELSLSFADNLRAVPLASVWA
ncbi:MAG: ATP-binding protein [Gammaproteobacteria bacterium]